QEISRADIVAGKLRATGAQTFQFTVSDGFQFSAAAYTATVNISPVQSCSSGSAELWFLNDESGSVGPTNFDPTDEFTDAKSFLSYVASGFTFSDSDFRGAIVSWSGNGQQTIEQSLTTNFSSAVDNYVRNYEGMTDPAYALNASKAAILAGSRTNVPSVVVLLTDATADQLTTNAEAFKTAANSIRATAGNEIVVMLIDEAADAYGDSNTPLVKTTIDAVAGSSANVIVGASYAEIADPTKTHINSLVGKVCSVASNAALALDTAPPTIAWDDPLESDNVIDADEVATVVLSGTTDAEDGQTVSIEVTDGNSTLSFTATVSSGAWTTTQDLSSLQDGSLSLTADVDDAAGNSATQATATLTKNTDFPAFTNWATPSNVCTGSYNYAAYTSTNSTYFGVDLNDDGELTSIYDHSYNSSSSGAGTSFTSPFILSGSTPGYKASAPVSMSSATALATTVVSDKFYLSGPDSSGTGNSDVIVYSFKIPGDASETVKVPYGDYGGDDQMLVTVQGSSGTVLASQFIAGFGTGNQDHSGDLTFTMPSDGVAYLRYYVIDLGGGYGDVLDGGCAIYDVTGPEITGPVGPSLTDGTTTGITSAISVNENQTTVVQVSATDDVTASANITWALSGDDAAKFTIAADGTITFNTAPDYESPNDVGDTANNNTYVVVITAEDEAGNTTSQTLTVTVLDVWDTLPGTVNDGDADGDGIADILESTSEDRDGDGVPDAMDFDPQGYLYCEDDGRILTGGSISVTRVGGGTSTDETATYDANGIWIRKDGSDGEYQWFVNAPGTYTMAVTYPSTVGVASTTTTSSGSLDLTTLLPANPASIGSSEYGSEGILANYRAGYALSTPPANSATAFYTTFVIADGDPNIIGNNIPVALCGQNDVAVSGTTAGAEANGGTPTQAMFTVSQGRVSSQDTVLSYSVSGTATSGADYSALT
ncbi:MAG: VWA domain-containing protein, partial [Flavobacteriia bacterium]|nr:VWA domain-containing protein [Flavobacteriia bacterium]